MNYIVTVTSKRQVTFPKKLLDELGVKKGDRLVVRKKGKKATIEPKGKGIFNMIGKFGTFKIPKGKTLEDLIGEATIESTKNVLR